MTQQAGGASGQTSLDWSHGTCEGSGPVRLTASPMNLEDIGLIEPLGIMVGGHVTPIDHAYFQPIIFRSPPDSYNVYSPMDGNIVMVGIEHDPISRPDKITVVIEGSCTFYVWYILLTSLTPEIMAQAMPEPDVFPSIRIPVKAGDLIGYIGGRTLDFSIINTELTLPGFSMPEHYNEPWKIHVDDPFKYFDEPLRSQLLELDLRTAEPRGGKIDYDIDGRLIGNWFVEGTNGYSGLRDSNGQEDPLHPYSSTHLAFAPDALDPSVFTVSIGSLLPDESNQFGVLGNAPDPAQVSVQTGLVVYELVQIHYADVNGQVGGLDHFIAGLHRQDNTQVRGTVLVQLIDDRHLRFELFMRKTAAQVDGFTDAAVIYER
jgi:hypothetical protein